MPEELKNNPDHKDFDAYLRSFMRRKEMQHGAKVAKEAANSLSLAVTL